MSMESEVERLFWGRKVLKSMQYFFIIHVFCELDSLRVYRSKLVHRIIEVEKFKHDHLLPGEPEKMVEVMTHSKKTEVSERGRLVLWPLV